MLFNLFKQRSEKRTRGDETKETPQTTRQGNASSHADAGEEAITPVKLAQRRKKKKQGIVRRRTGWWEWLKSLPMDWYLQQSENLAIIEWEKWQQATSLPAAVMANTVYVALQLGKREEDAFVTTKLRRSGMADRELTLSFHPLVFLEWFIVLGAVINMLYLFFYRAKRYQLRYTDEEIWKRRATLRHVTMVKGAPDWASNSRIGSIIWPYWKLISSSIRPDRQAIRYEEEVMSTMDYVELAVWDPSPFSMSFFCVCSPLHLFILYGMRYPSTSLFFTIALFILASVQLTWFNRKFNQRRIDERLLYDRLMYEYNAGFVYPKMFVRRQSVATTTQGVGPSPARTSGSTPLRGLETEQGALPDRLSPSVLLTTNRRAEVRSPIAQSRAAASPRLAVLSSGVDRSYRTPDRRRPTATRDRRRAQLATVAATDVVHEDDDMVVAEEEEREEEEIDVDTEVVTPNVFQSARRRTKPTASVTSARRSTRHR